MAVVPITQIDTLKNGYRFKSFTVTDNQENVEVAVFPLHEVRALLNTLDPNGNAVFVKVFLTFDSNTKIISMGMTGADVNLNRIYSDISGNNSYDEGLVSAQPCPPNCEGHDTLNSVKKHVVS
jgi:hypothetical protein